MFENSLHPHKNISYCFIEKRALSSKIQFGKALMSQNQEMGWCILRKKTIESFFVQKVKKKEHKMHRGCS